MNIYSIQLPPKQMNENATMTPDNEKQELLPCPFCGNGGSLLLPTCKRGDPYDRSDRGYPIVRCGNCHSEAAGDNWDHSGRSAIASWNRRATPGRAVDAWIGAVQSAIGHFDAELEKCEMLALNGQSFLDDRNNLELLCDWLIAAAPATEGDGVRPVGNSLATQAAGTGTDLAAVEDVPINRCAARRNS